MSEQRNILIRLQELEIFPPREIEDALRARLFPAGTGAGGMEPDWAGLAAHPVEPPPLLRAAVLRKTMPVVRAPRRLGYAYIAAAACMLFAVSITLLYDARPGVTAPADTFARHTGSQHPSTAAADPPHSDTAATIKEHAGIAGSPANVPGEATHKGTFTPALSIDGQSIPVIDNDLLYSFANLKETEVPRYFSRSSDRPLRIQVDQYSNITVSKTMVDMMKDLFLTRSNGKPARRARKTRERLDRWKKDDMDRFDRTAGANPLDAVDLGDFLWSAGSGRKAGTAAPLSFPAAADEPLTISYSIGITSRRSSSGIAETYNGGVQTLFFGRRQARKRLVSLMRIQDIFLSADKDGQQKATIVKESGKERYKRSLGSDEWAAMNAKYTGAVCKLTDDTVTILRYPCKRAVITLQNGKVITAWYNPTIRSFAGLDPAFASVPGTVLEYEYTYRKKTITYTATSISRRTQAAGVFSIPGGL